MHPGARLKTYQELVEAKLHDLLPGDELPPTELHKAMRYSCLAPGKRLRPALCLASAEAVSGPPTVSDPREDEEGARGWRSDSPHQTSAPVLEAACALEMVHCFSLIHDDLPSIDNDSLRRGAPTCHVIFGEAIAILAGDALFALAYDVLSHVSIEPLRVLKAVRILSTATGSNGLVGGEVMDVLTQSKEFSAETLEYIHSRKTGSLIAASCAIGGLIGGGTDAQVEALSSYGEHLGLAFQIVDDILNETSTPEQIGKSAGSDRDLGKATYPALYGLEGAQRAAEEHATLAVQALDGKVQNREVLQELADYAVQRFH